MRISRGLEKGDVQRVVLLCVYTKIFNLAERDGLVLGRALFWRPEKKDICAECLGNISGGADHYVAFLSNLHCPVGSYKVKRSPCFAYC